MGGREIKKLDFGWLGVLQSSFTKTYPTLYHAYRFNWHYNSSVRYALKFTP